jgi:quercetin dioxygenase-like cupin family protein
VQVAYNEQAQKIITVKYANYKSTTTSHVMKKAIYVFLLMTIGLSNLADAQDSTLFPKGEIATVDNHTGTVWLKELNIPDSTFTFSIAQASFAPGSKLNWHIHPAGQYLLITEGTGYYQEKGQPIQIVHKGDVVKCLPGIAHWHGASPGSRFTYVAVTPVTKGKTIWLQRVTDEEYHNMK